MSNVAPLIVHVIHRLDVGGMENGLVNLINHMPVDKYRHAIVSLTESTSFRERIHRGDVECFSLHKKPGQDLGLYVRLWRVFRQLRPAIVHTRNLSAVEAIIPAVFAGVPCRIHGEHGRDLQDIDGTKRRYQLLRRVVAPLIHRFIALSGELASYLCDSVGVAASKVTRIINGVDVTKFQPATGSRHPLPSESTVDASDAIVVGTVTRMQAVKDPLNLVRGFAKLETITPVKLVMVGDGPLLAEVASEVKALEIEDRVWLAGRRDDVSELLQSFDVFALSSRVEGISNTVLEAMATGLPVVATRVGGNAELIEDGTTGALVPPSSPEALASALADYVSRPDIIKEHGRAGRQRAEQNFGLGAMVARYIDVYDSVMANNGLEVRTRVSERSTACAG